MKRQWPQAFSKTWLRMIFLGQWQSLSSGCVESISPVSFEGTTVCQVCRLLGIVVGSVPAMPGVMKKNLVPGAICILLVR